MYICIYVFVIRRGLTLRICNTFPCVVPSSVRSKFSYLFSSYHSE